MQAQAILPVQPVLTRSGNECATPRVPENSPQVLEQVAAGDNALSAEACARGAGPLHGLPEFVGLRLKV